MIEQAYVCGAKPLPATFPSPGGYSCRISPLSIPNREVKTTNADGTAKCGRVRNCLIDEKLNCCIGWDDWSNRIFNLIFRNHYEDNYVCWKNGVGN